MEILKKYPKSFQWLFLLIIFFGLCFAIDVPEGYKFIRSVAEFSKDAIIETVAEKILSQEKSVAVIDSNQKIVGIVKPSKVIHTVFGGRKENS